MKRFLPYTALVLVVTEILLVLGSWLYSAASPMSGVRSLLSGEGVRWLLGHFAESMATPLLVWLLMLSMAWGCLRHCGILTTSHRGYRERRALLLAILLALVLVAIMALLALLPHAVLLSATGRLWPSPFSASLVPVGALSVVLVCAVYGIVAGRFQELSDLYHSLLSGIRSGAPWFLFYILLTQIYESLQFVLPR